MRRSKVIPAVICGYIVATTRLPKSRNGNPQIRVTLDDDTEYTTKPNASVAFDITSHRYRNVPIMLIVEDGFIIDIEAAK